jgi:hypothetical protein
VQILCHFCTIWMYYLCNDAGDMAFLYPAFSALRMRPEYRTQLSSDLARESRNRQTMDASPAEPVDLPLRLGLSAWSR